MVISIQVRQHLYFDATPLISVNSLWPSDGLWHQKTWLSLDQEIVVTCSVPIHYLEHWWLIISLTPLLPFLVLKMEILQANLVKYLCCWCPEICTLTLKIIFQTGLIFSCHDSSAVVTCAKWWPDWIVTIKITAQRVYKNFHLLAHKVFVTWSPDGPFSCHQSMTIHQRGVSLDIIDGPMIALELPAGMELVNFWQSWL